MRFDFSDISIFYNVITSLGLVESEDNVLVSVEPDSGLGQLRYVFSMPCATKIQHQDSLLVFENGPRSWSACFNAGSAGRGIDRIIGKHGKDLKTAYMTEVIKRLLAAEKTTRTLRIRHYRDGTDFHVMTFGRRDPVAAVCMDKEGRITYKKVFGPGSRFRRIMTSMFDKDDAFALECSAQLC